MIPAHNRPFRPIRSEVVPVGRHRQRPMSSSAGVIVSWQGPALNDLSTQRVSHARTVLHELPSMAIAVLYGWRIDPRRRAGPYVAGNTNGAGVDLPRRFQAEARPSRGALRRGVGRPPRHCRRRHRHRRLRRWRCRTRCRSPPSPPPPPCRRRRRPHTALSPPPASPPGRRPAIGAVSDVTGLAAGPAASTLAAGAAGALSQDRSGAARAMIPAAAVPNRNLRMDVASTLWVGYGCLRPEPRPEPE